MVVSIEMCDVTVQFARVIVWYQRIVCFHVSLAHHGDSIPDSPFHKEMHSNVCQQLQLAPSLFECVPLRPDDAIISWNCMLFHMVGYESSRKRLLAASHPFSLTDCGSCPVFHIQTHPRPSVCVCTIRLLCACRSACCKTSLCPAAVSC